MKYYAPTIRDMRPGAKFEYLKLTSPGFLRRIFDSEEIEKVWTPAVVFDSSLAKGQMGLEEISELLDEDRIRMLPLTYKEVQDLHFMTEINVFESQSLKKFAIVLKNSSGLTMNYHAESGAILIKDGFDNTVLKAIPETLDKLMDCLSDVGLL